MYGYDKLQDAVISVVKVTTYGFEIFDDGKVTTIEGMKAIPKLWELRDIFKNADEIWLQFKDLDEEEKQAIIVAVAKECELPNDKAEAIIEYCFLLILDITPKILALVDLIKS